MECLDANVVQDLMSGGPRGIWTLAFVITYAVIDRSRDTFASLAGFYAILGFAMAAFLVCGIAFAIQCIYDWRWFPIAPLTTELAMTVLFYIPVVGLLERIHHRFVGPLRREI